MNRQPREVFQRGARALGTWVKMTGHESIEILAHAGFDFVVIDMEHAPLSVETAARHISLASALGMSPMVRVPDHSPSLIQKILDAGAHGLFVPRVDSLAQAEAVAEAFSHPPSGTRGAGGTSKAGSWGLGSDYLAFGREQALLIVQLECEPVFAEIDRIAELPAIDGLFVGAADLSMSMGLTATDTAVQSLIDKAIAAAARAEKLSGLAFGASPDAVLAGFDRGIDFALAGNDTGLLAEAATRLVQSSSSPTQEKS